MFLLEDLLQESDSQSNQMTQEISCLQCVQQLWQAPYLLPGWGDLESLPEVKTPPRSLSIPAPTETR